MVMPKGSCLDMEKIRCHQLFTTAQAVPWCWWTQSMRMRRGTSWEKLFNSSPKNSSELKTRDPRIGLVRRGNHEVQAWSPL